MASSFYITHERNSSVNSGRFTVCCCDAEQLKLASDYFSRIIFLERSYKHCSLLIELYRTQLVLSVYGSLFNSWRKNHWQFEILLQNSFHVDWHIIARKIWALKTYNLEETNTIYQEKDLMYKLACDLILYLKQPVFQLAGPPHLSSPALPVEQSAGSP